MPNLPNCHRGRLQPHRQRGNKKPNTLIIPAEKVTDGLGSRSAEGRVGSDKLTKEAFRRSHDGEKNQVAQLGANEAAGLCTT